jgi:hypothetical protein
MHLMYLVEFQSRVLVFVRWAIQDMTFSRGARLITRCTATDLNFNHEIVAGSLKDTGRDARREKATDN